MNVIILIEIDLKSLGGKRLGAIFNEMGHIVVFNKYNHQVIRLWK